jgi:hypothetical protein
MSTVKAAADEVLGVLTEEITPNPKTHGIETSSRTVFYLMCYLRRKSVYLKTLYDSWSRKQGNLNLLYQLVAKGLPWPGRFSK